MACRTAGRLGCGGGPRILFPPSRLVKPTKLEKCVGDHRHQGVAMQTCPRASFEVVEAEFLLQLLVRLLADPSPLDGAGERLDWRVDWQVREVIFSFPVGTVFS